MPNVFVFACNDFRMYVKEYIADRKPASRAFPPGNALAARAGLLLGAMLWMGAGMGCLQPDPGVQTAGSATELGNVVGVLVASDRRAAAGVEVTLYPQEQGAAPTAPGFTDTTDAAGAFAFRVGSGVFRLLALDGAGSGVTVDSLLTSPLDTLNLREIHLTPLGGIRGFVKSNPSGARLELLGTPFDTTYPGNAEFIWGGIPAGRYWLNARQSAGTMIPNSGRVLVTVAAGTVTTLPDTIDLTTITLNLLSEELPYRLIDAVRPANGLEMDSLFWVLNGVRIESRAPSVRVGDITLTETMLDSARANVLEMFVHSGDSVFVARSWNITWTRSRPVKWAYQAVRAVVLAMEPDRRPEATRPGPNGINPQRGTFRVLEKRRLSPEELEYWEWSAGAGGDITAPEAIQASIYNPQPMMPRGCHGRMIPPALNFPGDTVTFFLLPDSILGAVAFRLRTDERFQDMDRLGYFARADWPLGNSFSLFRKLDELHTDLRTDGLHIAWPWNLTFQGSESRCQSTYRRFLVDSAGRVREILAGPSGIDSSRLLLHFRMGFGTGIDADSLPASGAYVYIDSAGMGVAGSPDSSRRFQLEAGALQELKTLLAALPNPVPVEWHREYATAVWHQGFKEALRYLVADQRGALHILEHPDAAPAKAGLFSQVELWLRGHEFL
jgi:hypothetical protein